MPAPLSLRDTDWRAPRIPVSVRGSTTSPRDCVLHVRPGESLIWHDPDTYYMPGAAEEAEVDCTWPQLSGAPGRMAAGVKWCCRTLHARGRGAPASLCSGPASHGRKEEEWSAAAWRPSLGA